MTSINTTSSFTTKPEAQLLLTMEEIIANAVRTIVVERDTMAFNQRGIEPTEPDDVTLRDWANSMKHRVPLGKRIRLGQLAGAFSLAAGRPVQYAWGPMGQVRLHAVSSLNRAMEAMGL